MCVCVCVCLFVCLRVRLIEAYALAKQGKPHSKLNFTWELLAVPFKVLIDSLVLLHHRLGESWGKSKGKREMGVDELIC